MIGLKASAPAVIAAVEDLGGGYHRATLRTAHAEYVLVIPRDAPSDYRTVGYKCQISIVISPPLEEETQVEKPS